MVSRQLKYCAVTIIICIITQVCFGKHVYEKSSLNEKANQCKLPLMVKVNEPSIEIPMIFGPDRKEMKPIEYSKKYRPAYQTGTSIPDQFDAREQWPSCSTISSIKFQSNCNSCWAVSVASAFSDRLCVATNGRIDQNMSAQHLLSCCEECTNNNPGCSYGGFDPIAWKYIEENGIPSGGDYDGEGCQPYEIKPCYGKCELAETPPCHPDTCTNSNYDGSYKESVRYGKSHYRLEGIENIQADIMKNGPATTGFDVYEDFTHYKGGVYKHTGGGDRQGGHAVRVIGWGHDDEGGDYWLVANSYSRHWGENGYFRILRGTNECNFEEGFSAGLPYDS